VANKIDTTGLPKAINFLAPDKDLIETQLLSISFRKKEIIQPHVRSVFRLHKIPSK
jgi:hypothetical protein